MEVQMIALAKRLWADRRGVSALEYGLLATLIAVLASTAMKSVGTALATTFGVIATTITNAQ
jgi:pilus assembly protein Flp/PilA